MASGSWLEGLPTGAWFFDARAGTAHLLEPVGAGHEADIAFNMVAIAQMMGHDIGGEFRGDASVPDIVRLHDNSTTVVASAQTAGPGRVHDRIKPRFFEGASKRNRDLIGTPL